MNMSAPHWWIHESWPQRRSWELNKPSAGKRTQWEEGACGAYWYSFQLAYPDEDRHSPASVANSGCKGAGKGTRERIREGDREKRKERELERERDRDRERKKEKKGEGYNRWLNAVRVTSVNPHLPHPPPLPHLNSTAAASVSSSW